MKLAKSCRLMCRERLKKLYSRGNDNGRFPQRSQKPKIRRTEFGLVVVGCYHALGVFTGQDRIVVSEIYPFITATNFGKNRMGNPASGGPSSNYADGDTPEFVASLVPQAIEEGQAQYFANDRLRQMAGSPLSRPRRRC
jgi:hypothetical protein